MSAEQVMDVAQQNFAAESGQAPVTDEAPTQEAPEQAAPRTFTQEELNEARRQEKDKLYPEISRLKDEVAELRQAREAEAARIAAEEEAAKLQAKKAAEEEMSVRELLQQKEQEWADQLERERQEREQAIALLEKERQYVQIQEYRQRRIEESREDIIPELIDLVSGESIDQIDASIAGLVERSSRILGNMAQAGEAARRELSGARVTAPPTGPLDTYSDSRTFTPEDLRDMSIEEYSQIRSSLLGSGANTDQGLFG